MKKIGISAALCLLMAAPFALAGCGTGTEPSAAGSNWVSSLEETPGSTIPNSGTAPGASVVSEPKQPERFTAADQSFSLLLPEGFVVQNTDAASGTTTWVHPGKSIVLTATSVSQGLQADALTKEAITQTLSTTYEYAEVNNFEQTPKENGTLFTYDAAVTQNGQETFLIQALYARSDRTVTLAMNVSQEGQIEAGKAMMASMAESLQIL